MITNNKWSWDQIKPAFNFIVLVASLGYFVDMYDLVLYGIVRIPSLKDMGITGDDLVTKGMFLLNMQMIGMLIGGIIWGILGDKKGRLSVLFGSIALYFVANIANAFVTTVPASALARFFAGVGLAGELETAITLVKGSFGLEGAAAIVGSFTIVLAVISLFFMEETYNKDLDYLEEN